MKNKKHKMKNLQKLAKNTALKDMKKENIYIFQKLKNLSYRIQINT